jgi:hypothetical protein
MELLPGGPTFHHRLSRATPVPPKCKTQDIKADPGLVAAESYDARLFHRYVQIERAQSLWKEAEEALRVYLVLRHADKIIGIAVQRDRALTLLFHDFFEPQIEGVMQLHIRQDR